MHLCSVMLKKEINIEKLEALIAENYVMKNQHPTEQLWIYNYTHYTQYESYWNEFTLQTRGLILNDKHEVIARPLPKFFNLSEVGLENLPQLPFEVYEKMDGSLGILYWTNGKPFVATRGSFNSEQSIEANNMLNTTYKNCIEQLDESCTYLFEIIYPENRIVVDYGDAKELVLVAIVESKTGEERELVDIGFPIAKKYNEFNTIEEILTLNWSNHEGFVLKYSNGYRVKIKFEEYVEIHRIITQVSSLSIWKALKERGDLKLFIENVPDEFYIWVKATEETLLNEYKKIEDVAKLDYKEFATRKETALYFQICKYPAILFAMYRDMDYSKHIWKMIRPQFEKAFTNPKN